MSTLFYDTGGEGADAMPAGPPHHSASSADDHPKEEFPRPDAEAAALEYWVSRSSHATVGRGSSEPRTTYNQRQQLEHLFRLNTPYAAHGECCRRCMWSIVLTFILQPFVRHIKSDRSEDMSKMKVAYTAKSAFYLFIYLCYLFFILMYRKSYCESGGSIRLASQSVTLTTGMNDKLLEWLGSL